MPRGRPLQPPKTALGAAMRAKRADMSGDDAAEALGIERGTYYRIERGAREPSADTALLLARWLGITMEEVYDAARRPPPLP
jgi:DNA-binding XRE family transcriptional regulator